MIVVAAVIEREDRRILIGQRRREHTSPLKWEFPGGKIEEDEEPEAALARELREELGATLVRCVEMGRVQHVYADSANPVEIRFYAAEIAEENSAKVFRTDCLGVAQGVWGLRFSGCEPGVDCAIGHGESEAGGIVAE